MLLQTVVFGLIGLTAAQEALKPEPPQAKPPPHPKAFGTFEENVIWMPPNTSTIAYPRIAELSDGTILATAGLNSTPGVFPVFSSADGGATWEWISNITDQVNNLGM